MQGSQSRQRIVGHMTDYGTHSSGDCSHDRGKIKAHHSEKAKGQRKKNPIDGSDPASQNIAVCGVERQCLSGFSQFRMM